MWSVILCGSLAAACPGTIETPTEEFPARQGSNSQAATANDDDDAPAPRPQAPAANDDDDDVPAPAAAADDDDEPLPPAADDEEDPPADEVTPPAGEVELSFEEDIQPIFNSTCGPCHAETAQSGINIGDSDIEAALENAIDREDRVFARIEAGTMPPACGGGAPGDPGCMSEEDLADVEAWYDAGSPP